jgi:tRNA/tmRNA/rRNA uracil-C5-methylase (TrmA/RlmC/RlmD family)
VNEVFNKLAEVLPGDPTLPLEFVAISGHLVTLIFSCQESARSDWDLLCSWSELSDFGVKGVFLHFHPSAGNRVFTAKGWKHAWGETQATDDDGFLYGPQSFHQVLPGLYHQALDVAEDFLTPTTRSSVVDLYCGFGASVHRWSRRGARVIGVELGGEAIRLARRNILAKSVSFLQGRCSERIPQLEEWSKSEVGGEHLAFVNPPRTGLEEALVSWLVSSFQPCRLAYLSCSPGTLARDLVALEIGGYTLKRLKPYDFFPQTHHIEVLALLERKNEMGF